MGSLASLHILVVEDNDSVRKAVAYLLKKAGYDITSVSSGFAALDKLQQHYFDLVISDYKMENMDGIELLAKIKSKWPATEVIIITAFGSIARGVEAIKLGAFDYLTKPFDNEELLEIVARFVEKRKTGKKLDELSVRLRNQSVFDPIIGKSEKIFYLLDIVNRIAAKESTILIKGESGTGKELIAKSIHALSTRKNKPF